MARSPIWHAREVGKLHYPKLKVDKIYSPMVTLDYNFALSLSFESSLQEYLSRAFAVQRNWKQAKYGEEENKSSLGSYWKIFTFSILAFKSIS